MNTSLQNILDGLKASGLYKLPVEDMLTTLKRCVQMNPLPAGQRLTKRFFAEMTKGNERFYSASADKHYNY